MLMESCACRKNTMTRLTPQRIKPIHFLAPRWVYAPIARVLLAVLVANAIASIAIAAPAPERSASQTLLRQAIAAQQAGQWLTALADVRKAIHAGNTGNAAINVLIAAARQQHQIGAAYLLVADLAAQHRLNASQSQNIIRALIRQGPVQKLPEQLISARNNSGYGTQNQWAWRDYLLGVAAAECGQHQQAINWLNAARMAKPKFWPATELLARESAAIYHFAIAQRILKSAIKSRWHTQRAWQGIVGIYAAQDRLRKALILAQEAAGKYPTNPEFQVLVGRIYGLREQQNLQQLVLQRTVHSFPHFTPAYLDLLEVAQSSGDDSLVEDVSHRYIRNFPGDIFSTVLQSRLAAQQGHVVLASRILTEALKNHPANAQLWLGRIELALALKQPSKAISLTRQALLLKC